MTRYQAIYIVSSPRRITTYVSMDKMPVTHRVVFENMYRPGSVIKNNLIYELFVKS